MKAAIRRQSALSALLWLAGCGAPQSVPASGVLARDAQNTPSWCASVDAMLAGSQATSGFRCLSVPNYLVTGFYGTATNPERSDFLNACFPDKGNAAERLRMSVRPAGDLKLGFRAGRTVKSGAGVDLSFLGPWAPQMEGSLAEDAELVVSVTLKDAEVRVLPSVPEILAQEYAASTVPERREALERCIASLCEHGAKEPLVYTAKVLAAVPMVNVQAGASRNLAAGVKLASTAGFERVQTSTSEQSLLMQAREKLNVAALLEPARAAFERAGTCELVRHTRTRRELTASLRELSLRTLAARDLDGVRGEADALRKRVTAATAFSTHEQGDLLSAFEAIDLASRELHAAQPTLGVCSSVTLLARVLTGGGSDNRLHDVLMEAAQPLHRRLLDLANSHALPCAEPAWFRDMDGDGYGDERVRVRSATQPAGFVANSLDCFDRNPDARPGQARYFTAHRGDGSFDYDCDVQQTRDKDLIAGGCRSITRFGIPIRCWGEMGWVTRAPGCGETGRWLADCSISTLSCDVPDERAQRMACR